MTVAEPEPGELSLTVLSAAQLRLQLFGLTVTLKLQETAVFPESVPLQLTGVVPTSNAEPDGGLQVTTTQLPVVVGDA